MSEPVTRSGPTGRPELASLGSGQDWARWLEQAHPAQPFGIRSRASGQLLAAWTALVHLARREGFAAALGDCAEGDALTTWRDRRIHVRRDATAEQAVLALAHQLAHVLLHGEIAYLSRSGSLACRGIRKTEADSVAYLVAGHLGIEVPVTAFPDPASWAGTSPRGHPIQTMQAVTSRVLAATATITGHLDAVPGHSALAAPNTRTAGTGGSEEIRRGRATAANSGQAHPAAASALHAETAAPRASGGAHRRAAASSGTVGTAGPATAVPVPRAQVVRAQQSAAQFFQGRLRGTWAPRYLAGRGFGAATQQRWQAGYAPAGWDSLTRHLRAIGYPEPVIHAAGLAHRSWRGTLIDTFRNRAMLPIRDSGGTIVAFIGRAPDHAGPDTPKYLNSPGTGLYSKRAVLLGLWEARELLARGALPVIVEGPFDAIAVTTAGSGRFAGVAPCGTALTSEHIAALGRFCDLAASGALVAFDPAQAGRKAAVAAYHLLSGVTAALTTVALPTGQDPADLLRHHGPAVLARALAGNTRPLADLVVDAEVDRWSRWLCFPEGQFNALRAAAPVIAVMPTAHVARQVARLADRLGLDHPTVTEAVTGALTDAVTGPASTQQTRPAAYDGGRILRTERGPPAPNSDAPPARRAGTRSSRPGRHRRAR